MLELAKRNLESTVIRAIDDSEADLKLTVFRTLTKADITGQGRIKPVAARHYAEKAELIQNLTNFYASAIGQDPDIKAHISSIKFAKLLEETLGIEDWQMVQPYIRLTEQAEAQRMANAQEEDTMVQAMTPSGVSQGDF